MDDMFTIVQNDLIYFIIKYKKGYEKVFSQSQPYYNLIGSLIILSNDINYTIYTKEKNFQLSKFLCQFYLGISMFLLYSTFHKQNIYFQLTTQTKFHSICTWNRIDSDLERLYCYKNCFSKTFCECLKRNENVHNGLFKRYIQNEVKNERQRIIAVGHKLNMYGLWRNL